MQQKEGTIAQMILTMLSFSFLLNSNLPFLLSCLGHNDA